MSYRELPPPPALASHVACLWFRTDAPGRVLPDGCVDLVWTGRKLIMAGPSTRAFLPEAPSDDVTLGVRFRVGAAGPALGLPAGELLDRSPMLDEIWSDGTALTQRVAEAPDARARLGVLGDVVVARLAQAPMPDPLVRAAVRDLSSSRSRIERLAEQLGMSERQLRRRFEAAVGYSPRTLARVLRLQRFLALARHGSTLANLAVQASYADQSHLTRDCSQLVGLAAAALLATGAGPAGECLTEAGCRRQR